MIISSHFHSLHIVLSDKDPNSPQTVSSLGSGGLAVPSSTSYSSDLYAVSTAEAQFYYAGLNSGPLLLYRTGKEKWSPPKGPEAYRRLKEVCEVFNHPIVEPWNRGLGWEVGELMDTFEVSEHPPYHRVY